MLFVPDLTLVDRLVKLPKPRQNGLLAVLESLSDANPPADRFRYPKSLATAIRTLYPSAAEARLYSTLSTKPGFVDPSFGDQREAIGRFANMIDEESEDPGHHVQVVAFAMKFDGALVSDECVDLLDRACVHTIAPAVGLQVLTCDEFFTRLGV